MCNVEIGSPGTPCFTAWHTELRDTESGTGRWRGARCAGTTDKTSWLGSPGVSTQHSYDPRAHCGAVAGRLWRGFQCGGALLLGHRGAGRAGWGLGVRVKWRRWYGELSSQ